MCATIKAIGMLVIGAVIGFTILSIAFCLLGKYENALWVMTLVFFGSVFDELKDIAGSIRTERYRRITRRIALSSGNSGIRKHCRVLKWVYSEYRQMFFEHWARFLFRIAGWLLLASAAVAIAKKLLATSNSSKGTCITRTKPTIAMEIRPS